MTSPRVGLIYDFRNPRPWRRDWVEHYGQVLDQISAAEELGFDEIWLSEHHFAEDGYLPSLFPVAAAVAARTRRIRIGTNALVAGLHHPLRVAEDAAVIDLISGGRLDLGLTLGFREVEFERYGIDPDFSNRTGRLTDLVRTLRGAFSGAQSPTPPPVQLPHPPLYLGANSPGAFRALAPLGLPLILIGSAGRIQSYEEALERAGFDPAGVPRPIQSLGMFLYVSTKANAWETVRPHARYLVETDRAWAGKTEQISDSAVRGLGIAGHPDAVAESIAERIRNVQPQQFCFFANPPGMAPETATASLRLFAQEVRPRLEELLGL